MLYMSVRTCNFKWPLRIIDSEKAGMFKYFFFYSITNEKNRTSDNKEEDSDEDNSEEGDIEAGNSEAESENASDMDVDISGMSYSCNVIILN